MTEAAQDQGWRKQPFDLHSMIEETKALVDAARDERIRRQKTKAQNRHKESG